MADYYTLLTNAGIAYETACKAAGVPIKLTQISVGDGGGAVYNPAATATALKREVWRGPLNALFQDEKNPSWLLAEVTIPPDVGGWYVREAGLWTDTGILYAIVKYPESFKPVLATSGSGKEFYIRSIFETSNASLVTLLIDDTVVKATRAWVMSYLAEELGKLDGKQSVRVAATANVVLNGAQQIDGVAVIAGDRVLLPSQTLAKDNGLWIVANGDWTRANDANVSAKVTPGLTVMVEEGTLNGDSLWHLTTNAPITLGTTALTFKMLAGRTGIAAGTYKSLSVDEYGRATAGSNPDTLSGFGIKDSYTKAEVEALIAKASALPVGSIVAFPVDTPPPGFLELDNSVKSSATYPDLSAYLGGKFNKGDEGVGNFRLPEARGEFLRGWDHGRGVDVGRAIGSSQLDSLQNISGYIDGNLDIRTASGVFGLSNPNPVPVSTNGSNGFHSASFDASKVARTSTETRGRNVAVMWCIKAWNAPVNQGNIDVAALVKEVSRLGSAVPVGAVMAFPTGIVPPGFLELDGSVQTIATYPDLATYLGTTYNKGDEGTGNFRLPDSRGEFLRGWDHGRGVDAGRNVGTAQADMLKAHNHSISSTGNEMVQGNASGLAVTNWRASQGVTGSAGGTETRPRNVAVMWCIKAWNAPINQGSIDVAALAKEVSQLKSSVPVGAVLSFPMGVVPAGYLELDGSVQSIATYPDLAAYLGTTFNKGDEGAGNFRLPESRGEFLRGWDHGRGIDVGRSVGSYQAGTKTQGDDGTAPAVQGIGNSSLIDADPAPGFSGDIYYTATDVTVKNFTNAFWKTVRPRNLAVMWCIKAWNAPVNQGSIDIAALAAETRLTRLNGAEVGAARNLRVSLPAAASVATLTADQLIVEQPGIAQYKLSDLNLSINLASIGAGGMDTGAAPISGTIGIYVIYNPDTKLAKLLGVNATTAVLPEVYGGTNMPAGYTSSALVSVWQTNASGQLVAGTQIDRSVATEAKKFLTNGLASVFTALSLIGFVPRNAKTVGGYVHVITSLTNPAGSYITLCSDSAGSGSVLFGSGGASNMGSVAAYSGLVLTSGQTLYYSVTNAPSNNYCYVTSYTF
ncbi:MULTISPECIES: tail fiber protein [unclassified Pseudomonas]|uniref:tail fiber protein n=1 Tax=unclassified Pseudomonas TaxID=196821 RepID=UPI0026BC0BD5|nr:MULTISPECIES: tail fiber protein [unclassified Pseudomonas]